MDNTLRGNHFGFSVPALIAESEMSRRWRVHAETRGASPQDLREFLTDYGLVESGQWLIVDSIVDEVGVAIDPHLVIDEARRLSERLDGEYETTVTFTVSVIGFRTTTPVPVATGREPN